MNLNSYLRDPSEKPVRIQMSVGIDRDDALFILEHADARHLKYGKILREAIRLWINVQKGKLSVDIVTK